MSLAATLTNRLFPENITSSLDVPFIPIESVNFMG